MKRVLALVLALCMVVCGLASCGEAENNDTEKVTVNHDDHHDDHDISTESSSTDDDTVDTEQKECMHSGGKATCTAKAICDDCGIAYGEIDYSEHQYVTVGEITDCGGNTVFEAKICIDCGDISNISDKSIVIHPHSFVRNEPQEPTCTEKGFTVWFECKNCGYDVKEFVDSLGHLWGGTCYPYDENYHIHKCAREHCDGIDKEFHVVNTWTLIYMPTCTSNGSMRGQCVDCGYWCTKILPAEHYYSDGEIIKEPSCTEKGTVLYTCIACGRENIEDMSPLGHDFTDYVLSNSNPANPCEHIADCSRCDTKDYKTIHDEGPWTLTNNPENLCEHIKECSRCQKAVYDTIHNFDNGTVTKDPTCLEAGNKLYVCQRCEFEENKTLSLYGHNEEILTQKDPTCTESGYCVYKCKRCNNLRTVYYKALGHIEDYEYSDDYHLKYCTRCQNFLSYEEPHNLEVIFEKVEKETETVYSLYYSCSICNFKKIIKEGVAHVHNKAEIISVTSPTCTEDGYLPGLKCATEGCNEIFIEPEAIEALGHDFDFFNACIRCGYEKFSNGLKYTLSEDETYYIVSEIDICTDIHINISSEYNEKPVKEIATNAFDNNDNIVSIKIPDTVINIGNSAFSGCNSLTSVIMGNGVTNIGNSAFSDCNSLTNITIPNSVMNIGNSAFSGCHSLTDITIPDSVMSIGSSAFYNCDNLTSVAIGDGVTSIASHSFAYCDSLTSITIGNGVTNIGNYAFLRCTKLANIIVEGKNGKYHAVGNCLIETKNKTLILGCMNSMIPNDGSVTSIGPSAFYGCSSLTSVTIPSSVKSIGSSAFYDCSGLITVTIPGSVASIGSDAFSNCSNLVSAIILDGVERIYNNVFYNCKKLINIDLPTSISHISNHAFSYTGYYNNESNWENDVLYIGKYLIKANDTVHGKYTIKSGTILIAENAFENCTMITSVIIPDGVETICTEAFQWCYSLTSVTIGRNVITIGQYAFSGCWKLVEIINKSRLNITIKEGSWQEYGCAAFYALEIHNGESKIINKDDYLFYTYGDINYLLGYVGEDKIITLPDDYNGQFYELYIQAFHCCYNITSVTIPNNIIKIPDSAFKDCTNLANITIPDSVTSIGSSAFYGCDKLNSITIPNSITSINSSVFSHCSSLTNITIPDSVTNIGSYAFSNCTNLNSIVIPNNVTNISIYAFEGCDNLNNVEFKNLDGWWVGYNPFVTSGPEILSSNLANKTTAATYLKSTYVNYIWNRTTV